jgi:hypothetical protein
VFLSKIWFFLIALAAAAAFAIALVMPRPAQRASVDSEQAQLVVACGVVDILLADDARNRVELAGSFSRAKEVVAALETASTVNALDAGRMKQVRDVAENVMKGISGRKPDFAILIDKRGRVVARVGLDQDDFGDTVAGRPLVDDALAGYLRDDIWAQNGTMYFVSAAPVIKRDPPVAYVGAVVLGHKMTNDLAKKLASPLDVDIGFYMGGEDVASSRTAALDHKPLVDGLATLKGPQIAQDCQSWDASKQHPPLVVNAGNETYTAVVARLPGEAMARGAFFSVFVQPPPVRGLASTLKAVSRTDVSFASGFPWLVVGGGFVLVLAIGIGLMWTEADRPLRRLAADTVRLAKGEADRLREEEHGGKFGSIARSVNIHIDKLSREAKSARTNLDQLLGPAPEGSLGTIDLLAGALPPARPAANAPIAPPPPSDFRVGNVPTPPPLSRPTPTPLGIPAAPPPRPPTPPARAASAPAMNPPPSAPLRLDDDILAPDRDGASGGVDPYFKQVFEQFVSLKRTCGEQVTGLTYEKFAEKLVKNRDDLMAKTGCREVRFTVYVKEGKAALKATPVKDE